VKKKKKKKKKKKEEMQRGRDREAARETHTGISVPVLGKPDTHKTKLETGKNIDTRSQHMHTNPVQ